MSARYFYYNTTASWYILVADNTHVFLQNLKEMLRDLTRRHVPGRQSVVLGNCISRGSSIGFLHGSAGWLMSRRAVGDFLEIAASWAADSDVTNDYHFPYALQKMKLSVREAASPYFLGHYLHQDDIDIMEIFNFSRLVKCPKPGKILCKRCQPFVAPFKKIVFFHTLSGSHTRAPPNLMDRYPSNLGWYMCGDYPHFCAMSGTTTGRL
jgi:hypothetical protein